MMQDCSQLHAHSHPLVSQPRAKPALPPPEGGSSAFVLHGTTAKVQRKGNTCLNLGGGSDCGVNDMSLAIRHHSMHLIMGTVSLWTRPPRPCTCVQGLKNYPSAVQKTPPMAADGCTVSLCVPVSVADELQLRNSTVICTSISGICRAQQRACQHPCPRRTKAQTLYTSPYPYSMSSTEHTSTKTTERQAQSLPISRIRMSTRTTLVSE